MLELKRPVYTIDHQFVRALMTSVNNNILDECVVISTDDTNTRVIMFDGFKYSESEYDLMCHGLCTHDYPTKPIALKRMTKRANKLMHVILYDSCIMSSIIHKLTSGPDALCLDDAQEYLSEINYKYNED